MMNREVEIVAFVICTLTQWRAFSTQFCLTLLQESLTHLRGGGLIGGFTVYGMAIGGNRNDE